MQRLTDGGGLHPTTRLAGFSALKSTLCRPLFDAAQQERLPSLVGVYLGHSRERSAYQSNTESLGMPLCRRRTVKFDWDSLLPESS